MAYKVANLFSQLTMNINVRNKHFNKSIKEIFEAALQTAKDNILRGSRKVYIHILLNKLKELTEEMAPIRNEPENFPKSRRE